MLPRVASLKRPQQHPFGAVFASQKYVFKRPPSSWVSVRSRSSQPLEPPRTCSNSPTCSPPMRSATGLRRKAAAASAALQAEVRDLSERLEALAASCKRREKAQGIREKTNALAQSMEIKRIQVLVSLPLLLVKLP